jgi:hypothetical protein
MHWRIGCFATSSEHGLQLKDWLLRNLLGAWSLMYWRIDCFATSSEHGLQCIEGLVASQPPRSVVFNALKGRLLCNLLGAWSLTSSMHFYSSLILSPPHTYTCTTIVPPPSHQDWDRKHTLCWQHKPSDLARCTIICQHTEHKYLPSKLIHYIIPRAACPQEQARQGTPASHFLHCVSYQDRDGKQTTMPATYCKQ